jgi:hypothetical protein
MMARGFVLHLLLAVMVAGLAHGQAEAAPVSHPDLSGKWVLDPAASDDLATAIGRDRGSPPEGRNPGRRGGMGRGGTGAGTMGGGWGGPSGMDPETGGMAGSAHFGGRGADEDRLEKMDDMRSRMQREYSELEIFQAGTEFNITDGLGISRVLQTDGRPMSIWTEQGELTATAAWEGQALVVHWKNRRGPGRTRSFWLSADGSQLTLLEERSFPGQTEPLKVKFVYRRAPNGHQPDDRPQPYHPPRDHQQGMR